MRFMRTKITKFPGLGTLCLKVLFISLYLRGQGAVASRGDFGEEARLRRFGHTRSRSGSDFATGRNAGTARCGPGVFTLPRRALPG